MNTMRACVCGWVVMAACGGDGGGGDGGRGSADAAGSDTSCSGEGTGHVIGSFNLTSLATVASARLTTKNAAFAIILDDTIDACSNAGSGDNDIAFMFAAAPGSANYTVVSGPAAGSGEVVVLLEMNHGNDVGTGSSGFVDIDSSAADCITGTFNVTFSGSHVMSGNFGANSCP